jgi:hypothetical protein
MFHKGDKVQTPGGRFVGRVLSLPRRPYPGAEPVYRVLFVGHPQPVVMPESGLEARR